MGGWVGRWVDGWLDGEVFVTFITRCATATHRTTRCAHDMLGLTIVSHTLLTFYYTLPKYYLLTCIAVVAVVTMAGMPPPEEESNLLHTNVH